MPTQISVDVIADSISPDGARITSLELTFPRFILSEVNTHRVASKSTTSSRAIPVRKMLSQVWNDPAMPVHWGKNQAGMQAHQELEGLQLTLAKGSWLAASKMACLFAFLASKIGLHKQVANRVLEPWQWSRQIFTSTDWNNLLELRDHVDAQPEFRVLAYLIKDALRSYTPVALPIYDWKGSIHVAPGDTGPRFHAPYSRPEEWATLSDYEIAICSAARCARASYNNHDGKPTTFQEDRLLFNKLALERPVHSGPLEHPAFAFAKADTRSRNFRGWRQFREVFEENGWGFYQPIGGRL
jgi:hypothetical protein